jgi:hypothetical protein
MHDVVAAQELFFIKLNENGAIAHLRMLLVVIVCMHDASKDKSVFSFTAFIKYTCRPLSA